MFGLLPIFDGRPLENSCRYVREIAENKDVNANNPIVATVKEDGQVNFYLYIGGEFVAFNPFGNDK